MQTRIMQLEAMLAAAQDEIEERDKAILELYQKYQEAQKNQESDEEYEIQSVSDNQTPIDRAKEKRKTGPKRGKKDKKIDAEKADKFSDS